MRKLLRVLALAATLCAGSQARAQGIPVFDGANWAQAAIQVQAWARQYQQMIQSLQQLQNQLTQMQTMTGKLDLGRGLGSVLSDPSIRTLQPDEMQNAVSLLVGGAYSASRLSAINSVLSSYGVQTTVNGTPVTAGQTSADALAKMQQILASAQQRNQLTSALATRVDNAADAKESLDLINRNIIESTRANSDLMQTVATIEANRQAERLRQIANDQALVQQLIARSRAAAAARGFQ